MPRIVGRLLRGVTIQTGQREGTGADAVYRPGPRGRTRLAGGAAAHRERVRGRCSANAAAGSRSPRTRRRRAWSSTRRSINLAVNLLGQLHAIDDAGRFRLLTIGEILAEEGTAETRELAQRVVEVGRAVRAYSERRRIRVDLRRDPRRRREHLDHVPSSLQWIEQQLRRRHLATAPHADRDLAARTAHPLRPRRRAWRKRRITSRTSRAASSSASASRSLPRVADCARQRWNGSAAIGSPQKRQRGRFFASVRWHFGHGYGRRRRDAPIEFPILHVDRGHLADEFLFIEPELLLRDPPQRLRDDPQPLDLELQLRDFALVAARRALEAGRTASTEAVA